MNTGNVVKYGFFVLLTVRLAACIPAEKEHIQEATEIEGETMGTTYMVKFTDSVQLDLKSSIDSILVEINLELSTYIDSSLISRLNQAGADTFLLEMPETYGNVRHFPSVFQSSLAIYDKSEGSFDPTVMPVVNYWGFGYEDTGDPRLQDSMLLDSLRGLVGMEKLVFMNGEKGEIVSVLKQDGDMGIDFSAIAKGYAVDYIGEFLESKQIRNYLVEIGGEVRARGINTTGDPWTIGVNIPDPGARLSDFLTRLRLENASCATSGNYRNYIEIDGIRYGHTINPLTARPEINRLLSASIVAKECMLADGWATACMVMGFEKSRTVIMNDTSLEGLLIYSDPEEGVRMWQSENFPTISETDQK